MRPSRKSGSSCGRFYSDTASTTGVPGNNANFYVLTGGGSYTVGRSYHRTEVGDFENSESPYDTFDKGGNVWQ